MNHVSLDTQRSTARLFGALAHELNNPLQGILSRLAVLSQECRADEATHAHVEQIRTGMNRFAKALDYFSVVFENLPRLPDEVGASLFAERLVAEIEKHGQSVSLERSPQQSGTFYCLAPELIRLVSEALCTNNDSHENICLSFETQDDAVVLICELGKGDDPELSLWRTLEHSPEIAGLPVLLEEVVRQGNGAAEFRYDHLRLRGVKLSFEQSTTQVKRM